MDRLPTRVDLGSDEFASRKAHNTDLLEELRDKIEEAKGGGGGKYVERHRQRGKKMARERISEICDPGAPFLELSSLAALSLIHI